MFNELKGVFCAIATPVEGEYGMEKIDEVSFRNLLRHVVGGGVDGIVVLGTAGEFASLTFEQKIRVVEIASDELKGRVPLVAGASHTSFSDLLNEVRAFEKAGAGVVLVAPPYYYRLSQEAIIKFYKELAARTGSSIILYNNPGYTKNMIEVETVKELSLIENIIGIKDTTRDFVYLQKILFATKQSDRFRVFLGTDSMLAAGILMGIDGVISITPNVDALLDVKLWEAFNRGEFEKVREYQERIIYLLASISGGVFPAGIKESLKLLGLTGEKTTAPGIPLSEEQAVKLREDLKHLQYKVGGCF